MFVLKLSDIQQGRKRPLDTPKRIIERERKVEGEIYRERERERFKGYIERKSERESHRALPYRVCALVENLREISQA